MVGNHVKLSFLSAAFDPQEIVQRSQIYECFMPILVRMDSWNMHISLVLRSFIEIGM